MQHAKEQILCTQYPKIFKSTFQIPDNGFYIWGIDCGEGWFEILDVCCDAIQRHIDASRIQRKSDLIFNRALKKAIAGNRESLIRYFSGVKYPEGYVDNLIEDCVANERYKEVREAVPQVVATQVKEKFGLLSFYYNGGDDYTDGIIATMGLWSSTVCEVCGEKGRLRGRQGWLYTSCKEHSRKFEI